MIRKPGLQCLSAFVRFGTAKGLNDLTFANVRSPMPFGIRPFRDMSSLR